MAAAKFFWNLSLLLGTPYTETHLLAWDTVNLGIHLFNLFQFLFKKIKYMRNAKFLGLHMYLYFLFSKLLFWKK